MIQTFANDLDVKIGLLWQHNAADKLHALLSGKQAWFDRNHGKFWNDWYHDVFDLRTANEFGCQVWAQILGLRLVSSSEVGGTPFGFNGENFDNGTFTAISSNDVVLPVDLQRIVLRLRYYQLVSKHNAAEVNRVLNYIFKDYGPIYVRDNLNMSITYVFGFVPDPRLIKFIEDNDLLPRPSTVEVSYITVAKSAFGFGDTNKPFDQGSFVNLEL